MCQKEWFSVDRLVGAVAVLEDREGNTHDVPLAQLPEGVAEGARLRLVEGVYRVDEQETNSRRQKILDLQNRLRSKNNT